MLARTYLSPMKDFIDNVAPEGGKTGTVVTYDGNPVFIIFDADDAINYASEISPDEGVGNTRPATLEDFQKATHKLQGWGKQIGWAFDDDSVTAECCEYLSPDEGAVYVGEAEL